MKRMIVVAAGAVALIAGSAHAGGGASGCAYGHGAQVADTEQELIVDETDPELLALLKKKDDAAELEKIVETPIIHN